MCKKKFTPGQKVYRVSVMWPNLLGGHVSEGIVSECGDVAFGMGYFPPDDWWPSRDEAMAAHASEMEAHAHRILDFVAKVRQGAAEAAGQPPQAGFLREKPLAEGVKNAGP
jgi:hypothetical protein